MKDVLIGAYYRHYKNKPYKVLDVAKHSEDLQDYVVYKTLYENDLAQTWIRPKKIFLEKVTADGVEKDRFELLAPDFWPVSVPFKIFHSHIYFDEKTEQKARVFHEKFKNLNIPKQISQMHYQLLGPHPHWMFEVDFQSANFLSMIQFMQEHRDELNILVHPLSGNGLFDHTYYACFLGKKLDLDLSVFQD